MKLSLKGKKDTIVASLLVAAFFFLHYTVYLEVGFLTADGLASFPVLQSYTDAPVDFEEVALCEQEGKRPGYLNPFQKVQYRYQIVKEGYSECDIIEEAEFLFTSNMVPVSGDLTVYYDGFDEDGFGRSLVENWYPNLLFFLVQYLIVGALGYVLLRPTEGFRKKKS